MTKKLIILFVAIGVASVCQAQGNRTLTDTPPAAFTAQTPPAFAIRTNLVYWGTLTPNLGVEFGLSHKMTLNLIGAYNPWNLNATEDNYKKMVHFLVEPELRYWFCERFNGHALGVHGIYSSYNVAGHDIQPWLGKPLLFEKDFRYEGSAFGAGASYNYHWMLGKHFGLEFQLGIGFAYMKYDKFDCQLCADRIGTFTKTYIGPTKIGINLIFVLK